MMDDDSVEQSVEWELARETEVLGGNLPQCIFAKDNSPKIWTLLETATNHQSHGTASFQEVSRLYL
jgi:hypothetical protein